MVTRITVFVFGIFTGVVCILFNAVRVSAPLTPCQSTCSGQH